MLRKQKRERKQKSKKREGKRTAGEERKGGRGRRGGRRSREKESGGEDRRRRGDDFIHSFPIFRIFHLKLVGRYSDFLWVASSSITHSEGSARWAF